MTEAFIRQVAERFGLEVLRRITTGNPKAGFATFELSGVPDRVCAAWDVLRPETARGMGSLSSVNNPEHPDHGQPFIELQSVWVEEGK